MFKIPKAQNINIRMPEHKNGKKDIYFFSVHETIIYISIMLLDNTVASIAAVFFKKKAAIIIALYGQKPLH